MNGMAWSMAVAEPIGIVVGVACGRLCANYGRQICKSNEVPDWLGGLAGGLIGHYAASVLTKAVFNTIMVDPVGGAANVAVTSPATALLHSIYEGVTSIIPDLDGDGSLMKLLQEVFNDPVVQEPLAQIASTVGRDTSSVTPEASAPMTSCADGHPHLPAQGYVPYSDPTSLISIADIQVLNTCGLEAIENMAQLAGAPVGNDLSQHVIQMGGCNPQVGFPMDSYRPLLEAVGCTSLWFDATDFDSIIKIVSSPGGSVGFYGDAYYLGDPIYTQGGPGQLHAITLVEPWIDPGTGQLVGVIGLDSNHQGHAMGYTFEQLRNFLQNSTLRIPRYQGKALMCLPGPSLLG
jgi:hypothetical protein